MMTKNERLIVSEYRIRYSIKAAAIVAAAIDNPPAPAQGVNTDGKPEFILTIGNAASGKTTLARRDYPAAVVMDCDAVKATAIAGQPLSNPAPATWKKGCPKTLAALHRWSKVENDARVDATLASGPPASGCWMYDSTGCSVERMSSLIDAARRGGWFTVLYFCDVTEATSIRRNAARGRVVPADVIAEKHRLVGAAWVALRGLPDAAIRVDNDADDPAMALPDGIALADIDAADAYADALADSDADAALEMGRLAGVAGVAPVAAVAIGGAVTLAAATGAGMFAAALAIVVAAIAIGRIGTGPGRGDATRRASWTSGRVRLRRDHRMLVAASVPSRRPAMPRGDGLRVAIATAAIVVALLVG